MIIIIIIIIESTKYVLDILPGLFAGSNMQINHFYLSYSIT